MSPEREIFWQIEYSWLFYILTGLSVCVFLAGIGAYIYVWKKKAKSKKIPLNIGAIKETILDILTQRRLFQGDLAGGLIHFLIFWGFLLLFLGTLLLSIDHYLTHFLKNMTYLTFSFAMDLSGLMLFIGIVWATIRRYIERPSRLERRLEDGVVALWILLLCISGFIVEALRLANQHPSWGKWSFIGWWISALFSPVTSRSLYPYFWWIHAGLAIGLIGIIPFTKLFHIIGATLGIYLFRSKENGVQDTEEEAGEFDLGDLVLFDVCTRCGRCVEVCPSSGAGEPFAPRDFIQAMRTSIWNKVFPAGDIRFLKGDGESQIENKIWYCTTCRACLEMCPVYVSTFEMVVKRRTVAIEEGIEVPRLMNQTLERLFNYDNPWESSKKRRGAWSEGMDIPDLSKGDLKAEICYFVGCTTSFDDTAQRIARAFSSVLKYTKINFGILGSKEPCCGDIAKRVGELGLFIEQREKCLETFERYGIREIATSSPHCFHTFQNEYPKGSFRVRHYVLVLHELLKGGRLRFKKEIKTTVTYHDPCYLGRHNRIFDEPRKIITSIPGIRLVEMAHHRTQSLCCGGGGGRMWQEIQGETKMSEVRIREAEATGAQILITACPLCLIMLEDARKGVGLKELRIMDLNELVLEAIDTK